MNCTMKRVKEERKRMNGREGKEGKKKTKEKRLKNEGRKLLEGMNGQE